MNEGHTIWTKNDNFVPHDNYVNGIIKYFKHLTNSSETEQSSI